MVVDERDRRISLRGTMESIRNRASAEPGRICWELDGLEFTRVYSELELHWSRLRTNDENYARITAKAGPKQWEGGQQLSWLVRLRADVVKVGFEDL